MADSYLDGDTFWCYETPSVNPLYSKNRILCSNLIVKTCGQGSPGGGGLQGDCDQTEVNNGLILCDPDDSWNCNLCGNDLPYFSPVRVGDPFMFQFQQWDYINGQTPAINPITGQWGQGAGWGVMVDGSVYDCCTEAPLAGDILSYAINHWVGIYPIKQYNGTEVWKNIQMIELDLAAIYNAGITNPDWDGCFYLKFFFYDSNGNVIREFNTEPFKFDPCQPDDTLFLEGVYKDRDCFEYYYGNPASNPNAFAFGVGTPFQYRNTYRVKGSFELEGFEINKELVGVRQFTASTETTENWLFRTNRIPSRVARLLRNILAAEFVYVNNIDYISTGSYTKNNEVGNQWFLESQLKRVQCSSTTSCD